MKMDLTQEIPKPRDIFSLTETYRFIANDEPYEILSILLKEINNDKLKIATIVRKNKLKIKTKRVRNILDMLKILNLVNEDRKNNIQINKFMIDQLKLTLEQLEIIKDTYDETKNKSILMIKLNDDN